MIWYFNLHKSLLHHLTISLLLHHHNSLPHGCFRLIWLDLHIKTFIFNPCQSFSYIYIYMTGLSKWLMTQRKKKFENTQLIGRLVVQCLNLIFFKFMFFTINGEHQEECKIKWQPIFRTCSKKIAPIVLVNFGNLQLGIEMWQTQKFVSFLTTFFQK